MGKHSKEETELERLQIPGKGSRLRTITDVEKTAKPKGKPKHQAKEG